MYVKQCGYFDNGRLMTWLPYQRNQDSSALVHDISQEKLLGDQVDKYYAVWYSGPQVSSYNFYEISLKGSLTKLYDFSILRLTYFRLFNCCLGPNT